MRPDVLIVGQGLAGTVLGWALGKAGVDFAIADTAEAGAASRVAAGLANPITGRRLVKSWRVDELLPLARRWYAEIGADLGVNVWHDVRIHRLFADDTERATYAAKTNAGELAPYASAGEDDGFWIEGGGRLDLAALLTSSRERWRQEGRLHETALEPDAAMKDYAVVIDCRGQVGTDFTAFRFVPWEYSKGEMIEMAADDLAVGLVLNRRHWLAPVGHGRAWVGATHEPGNRAPGATGSARATLKTSAESLLNRPVEILGQRAGVRVNLPDKRPVAGRHPQEKRLGLVNGLGAKGVLFAPWLATQWARHLGAGAPFDPAIDVRRFWTER